MIKVLEYRLAWSQPMRNGHNVFHAFGDRYPTKEAARRDAERANQERVRRNKSPATYILFLPMRDSDCDPSHFIDMELL